MESVDRIPVPKHFLAIGFKLQNDSNGFRIDEGVIGYKRRLRKRNLDRVDPDAVCAEVLAANE